MATVSQTQLDIQITNFQCCAANMASNLIDLIRAGDLNMNCYRYKFLMFMSLLRAMEDYTIIDGGCIDEDEICAALDRMNVLCSECCA